MSLGSLRLLIGYLSNYQLKNWVSRGETKVSEVTKVMVQGLGPYVFNREENRQKRVYDVDELRSLDRKSKDTGDSDQILGLVCQGP